MKYLLKSPLLNLSRFEKDLKTMQEEKAAGAH